MTATFYLEAIPLIITSMVVACLAGLIILIIKVSEG